MFSFFARAYGTDDKVGYSVHDMIFSEINIFVRAYSRLEMDFILGLERDAYAGDALSSNTH